MEERYLIKCPSERRGTSNASVDLKVPRYLTSRLYRRRYLWPKENRGLKSPRLFISTSSRRFWVVSSERWVVSSEFPLNYNITAQRVDGHAQCHPEFSSGSVRGEEQEKARSEMLKQVQHDIWSQLLFLHSFWWSQFNTFVKNNSQLIAQIVWKTGCRRRNSRGFLNPWRKDISLKSVWKTGNVKRVRGLESPAVFNFASLQTPLLCGQKKTEGLKAPGYSYPRLPDVFE